MKVCILCGSKKYKKLFDDEDWEILKCAKCGLVKTEGGRIANYEEYHRLEEYRKFEEHFRHFFQKRFKIVWRFKPKPGRVLDIGASTGVMLAIFQENGWEVWGVEPSKSADEVAKRNIKISKTKFEEADLPKNYFDVVILNHTLEHMLNPVEVLRKVQNLLKPGGIILVDVPNFGSLSARILGKKWPYLMPEEHKFHFTPQTLQKILKEGGFQVKYWETRSGIFDFGDPVRGLLNEFTSLRKRFIFDLLTSPFALFVTLIGAGTILTAVGRKKT